jgi:hypothetical protein
MRAMVLIRTDGRDPAPRGAEEAPGEAERFDAELVRAGVLLASERVRADADVVLVRSGQGARAVATRTAVGASGPISGLWLWQVRSLEEATEWAMRAPELAAGAIEIEIRQVIEPGDDPGAGR